MTSVASVSWFQGSIAYIHVFTSNGTTVTEQVHDGSWHPGLFSCPGSSVAATSWTAPDGVVHMRVFAGHEGTIREYRWDSATDEWTDGPLSVVGQTASATMFFGTPGRAYLRTYVRTAEDVLHEYYSDASPAWGASGPFGAKSAGAVAAVAWDEGATWNVRVFTTAGATNMEYRHIHGWESFPLAVTGTVLTATRWRDASNNVQMRLYTRGGGGDITEWRWEGNAWVAGPGVAQGVSAAAMSYLTPDGAPHIRLYVVDANGTVRERAWDGAGYYDGIYPGALAPVRWWTVGGTLQQSRTTGPFVIRGVCYSRTLIGEDARKPEESDSLRSERSSVWTPDLTSMRNMGANAIKIYNLQMTNKHHPFLDAAWNNGVQPIYVTLSLWIEPQHLGNSSAEVEKYRAAYRNLVRRYAAHPAVLGFSIGAEVNTGGSRKGEAGFWDDFILIARSAREALQATGQQKIITTGLIDGMADVVRVRKANGSERDVYPPMGTTPGLEAGESEIGRTPADFARLLDAEARGGQLVIDVFGFDIYKRADGFAQTFTEYYPAAFTRPDHPAERPLLIAEFGEAASSQTSRETPQERDAAAMNRLVAQLRGSWQAIAAGARSCGGCIFAWADEWWKDESPLAHNLSPTAATMNYKDVNEAVIYLDEEWFGLNRLVESTNGATLATRQTYDAFRELWNS
jgi:hypothetical protein